MPTDPINLTDSDALRVLSTYAKAHAPADPLVPDAGLAAALREFAGAPVAVADGDLARASLALLATDPATAQALTAVAKQPADDRLAFDPAVIVIGAAVLIALSTYVRFERDKEGKWSLVIEKKDAPIEVIKDVVAKLLGKIGL